MLISVCRFLVILQLLIFDLYFFFNCDHKLFYDRMKIITAIISSQKISREVGWSIKIKNFDGIVSK